MLEYSKRSINTISFIISIIILIMINCFNLFFRNFDFKSTPIVKNFGTNIIEVKFESNTVSQRTKEENIEAKQNNIQNNHTPTNKIEWKLIIPAISLEAEISEGTTKEVMNKYVGHFIETSKTSGNIGLAAHNRGYEVNYFENLKNLKEKDEIQYIYKNFKEEYIVEKNIIIQDTNWDYLKPTNQNTITLITCVENEPEYRRCIVGISK